MKTPILKMTNIIKEFPGVKALDGVNLELYEGKVMALMGENGAGKLIISKKENYNTVGFAGVCGCVRNILVLLQIKIFLI